MNFQRGGNLPPVIGNRAALRLGLAILSLLLLGTQRSPAPISPPNIVVTISQTNGIAPMLVQFVPAADAQPGGIVITNWLWNFGDGSPAVTNPAPVHVFLQPGTFTTLLLGMGNGVAYPGSLTSLFYTPITVTATGAVFTVTGSLSLSGVTGAFSLTNGVLLAEAGSVAGQTVPVYAPLKFTATGVGSWTFSATLTVPLTRNANATYSLSAFPASPLMPNAPLLVEYNDGLGHSGVLIATLGALASP
jgi:hypothetical protein